MRVVTDPKLDRWPIRSDVNADRTSVAACVAANAKVLGTPLLSPTKPLLVTGHQAWFWHPGILAKYIAVVKAGQHYGADLMQIVVDHDVHDALSIELPIHRGGYLSIEKLELAPQDLRLPLASSPPADVDVVCDTLRSARDRFGATLVADLEAIMAAFEDIPPCQTLAQQMSVVLNRLMKPYTGSIALLFATDLTVLQGFDDFLEQMLFDIHRCVKCYNRVVQERPEAGIAPLRIEARRVEVPFWALTWQQPRRRVFADLTGRRAVLTLENGQPIDMAHMTLAPRAMLLTGLLRYTTCDMFVHGTGGAIYDRLTELWFRSWLNVELAPAGLVSADLHMSFNAPLAEPEDVIRAKWWVHHLPHNLDRALGLSGELADQKRILLTTMGDDDDRMRRAAAFEQIRRINDTWARQHPQSLDDARQRLAVAQAGVANRHISHKRDWCFALYRPEQLRELTENLDIPK